jgi:regulator of sirC expression with transglutaminase-like and TPR domain
MATEYANRRTVSRKLRHTLGALIGILGANVFLAESGLAKGRRASDLLDALLAVDAAHASLCGTTLEADQVRTRIAKLTEETRTQMLALEESKAATSSAIVQVMNGIVFGRGKLRPSQDLHDPCNLLVSGVLTRRQGYCVGVAGVYLSIAEALGLPIKAVATPTHVFLRYDDGKTRINIETFNGGTSLSDEQYVSQQRIAPESIRKGVFLANLSTDRFIAQVHSNLGVIYSERRDYARADDEYALALRLDKRLPAAWYNRGKILIEQGDLEGAIRSFGKALRLHPNDTWALNNRGLAYKQLGKTDKARADFEAALRIDPAFEPARSNLAPLRGEPALNP